MHRVLTTRTGALTLAIILAAAAALMVFVYVKGYQSDVNGRSNEVSVLVANQTLDANQNRRVNRTADANLPDR